MKVELPKNVLKKLGNSFPERTFKREHFAFFWARNPHLQQKILGGHTCPGSCQRRIMMDDVFRPYPCPAPVRGTHLLGFGQCQGGRVRVLQCADLPCFLPHLFAARLPWMERKGGEAHPATHELKLKDPNSAPTPPLFAGLLPSWRSTWEATQMGEGAWGI